MMLLYIDSDPKIVMLIIYNQCFRLLYYSTRKLDLYYY